jgi:hypothetical protein
MKSVSFDRSVELPEHLNPPIKQQSKPVARVKRKTLKDEFRELIAGKGSLYEKEDSALLDQSLQSLKGKRG